MLNKTLAVYRLRRLNYNFSGKSALLILNRNYHATTEWEVLPGVVEDGENMKEMLQKQGFEVLFVYKS